MSDAWRANKKKERNQAHLSLGAASARWWAERGRKGAGTGRDGPSTRGEHA